MSIFKIKQWWSNSKLQNEEYEEGIQNATCIKIDKFNAHSDSDCIIIGQGDTLNIYKPNIKNINSQTILESKFNEIVLQIETGKFLPDSADCQIIILHPNSYAVYVLERKCGHIDIGDQNSIIPVIKHSFTKKAYSIVCGPFGSSKSRHLICIQALDGTLSFFDQDTFLYMCMFNDIIIPGPICYVANSDQFVICKSTWVLEIFSYQQLSELSELSVRQNKKNIPQWTYNAGEEIVSMQVIRTSSNFSSILAVGERHLYCFQDNGLMKYMLRFDYMPICFHAYLIGWYYEPNSRLLVMVASEDSKLNVYEDTKLLWSCDLTHQAISISRCFLNSLSGGVVTLSNDGTVYVSYLGTEPDLNTNANPLIETTDPEKIQSQIDAVEESLQKVMDAEEEIEETYADIEGMINIKIDIGNPVVNTSIYGTEPMRVSPMVVQLTTEDPKLIQSIQVTYDCVTPVTSSETTVCLDNINGTEIVETYIYLLACADVTVTSVTIIFTIIETSGKIRILEKKVFLPLSLFSCPVVAVVNHNFSLPIKLNQTKFDFREIFNEFTEEELKGYITPENTISFAYRTTDKTVTLKLSNDICAIEANTFSEMLPFVEYFIYNLNKKTQISVMDFQIHCDLTGELVKQIVQSFLKSIEGHVKERIILKQYEEELSVLQKQFTVIQKRLLVQYGSLPPGNCDPLEFLMKDTHERIKSAARIILERKENVIRASGTVRGTGQLIINILKDALSDNLKVKLIEDMLSLNTLNYEFQEWEEAVFQGSSYILNIVLKKSEKDKEKLAPLTDQDILSKTNLKKLLKQLRLILDKVFKEIKDSTDTAENTTRIEELVEVI